MSPLNKIGSSYKGFVLSKKLFLEEIEATLFELVHTQTGATVLHLCCEDEENAFCFALPTYPSSSNGAPHILEHIVLCGSKKYPVKDPFFAMTRRSVATFMNAMTGPDFTLYLASSQVEKDFFHLMQVYLDAVFFPELKKMSFLQEGHRLELKDPKDMNSPLIFQGVVFNEMKGSMGSSDSRLFHHLLENLFPDLPYAYNSGGDPAEIPLLSYQELLEFHKTFYQPSHCLFYFYGNIALEKHLDFLQENLLSKKEKSNYLAPFPLQPRFTSPVFVEKPYPISKEQKKEPHTIVSFSWLTSPLNEQKEILALSLLDTILMEHDASLLKKELLKANLAGEFYAFLDTELSEVPWILIAKGVEKKKVEKLRLLIFETLEKIASSSIAKERVEAAMHQMEFSRLEISGGGLPYGLSLFMRAGLLKMQGSKAEEALKIHTLLQALEKDLKDPLYLPSLIEKYWIMNPHFVQLTLTGEETLLKKEEEEEKRVLEKLQQDLTKAQKQKILSQMEELKSYQEKQDRQDVNLLPFISLEDLPREPKNFCLQQEEILYFHDSFTNHITYVDIVFALPDLSEKELTYLPFFLFLLGNLGSCKKGYEKLLQEKERYTGGVYSYLSLNKQATDVFSFIPTFTLRGKALDKYAPLLFSLLKEILFETIFTEKERIQELLLQEKTYLESQLAKNAMNYASSLAASSLSKADFLQDLWYGYGFLQTIRSIFAKEKELESLLPLLQNLYKKIFLDAPFEIVIAAEEKTFFSLKKDVLEGFVQRPSPFPEKKWEGKRTSPTKREAYTFAVPVCFTASAFLLAKYTEEEAPCLCVIAELLQNLFLHPEIREKGGAYGGGATFDPLSGKFSFYAYRDPHLAKTLFAFENSVKNLAKGSFTKEEILEAKLGLFQSLDSPVLPKDRAQVAFFYKKKGKSFEARSIFRQRLASLEKKDILRVLEERLIPNMKNFHTVTFTSETLLEKEKMGMKEPFSSKRA